MTDVTHPYWRIKTKLEPEATLEVLAEIKAFTP
jgi:hypothetical protein